MHIPICGQLGHCHLQSILLWVLQYMIVCIMYANKEITLPLIGPIGSHPMTTTDVMTDYVIMHKWPS